VAIPSNAVQRESGTQKFRPCCRFVNDGCVDIDFNAVERAIRPMRSAASSFFPRGVLAFTYCV
jgi:hypothetical protein